MWTAFMTLDKICPETIGHFWLIEFIFIVALKKNTKIKLIKIILLLEILKSS
jgi:hypothetical protein